MESKIKHLMYVPFTGLGLYNGFRGNRWLRNRIAIFNQFVIPSLKNQTKKDFVIWISWRREERSNLFVQQFYSHLKRVFKDTLTEVVFTYSGVCFYDDKYPDEQARDRLINAVHGAMPELFALFHDSDYVLMTIQPSDDLYHKTFAEGIQNLFKDNPSIQAAGFQRGYICNYMTKEVAEYNPTTNPPFYTIKFPREDFIDPLRHVNFTGLKQASGKYAIGTPCPSHEYVPECFCYALVHDLRGFLVGTHGENISTTYVHPFKGKILDANESYKTLKDFGILDVPALTLKISMRKKVLRMLPHSVQRKLRYVFGEKLWQACYNFLRS